MKQAKHFLLAVFIIFFASSLVFAQEAKVFFSPKGGCTRAVVDQLSQARETLDIAIYSLSSEEIAKAILRAKTKGAKVRVLCDRTQNGQRSSQNSYLKSEGIDVRVYEGSGLMHNKFALIDKKALITGSFNWTQNAEEDNAENLLVLTDKKVIALYAKNFENIWAKGKDLELKKGFQKSTSDSFQFFERILREMIKFFLRQIRQQFHF